MRTAIIVIIVIQLIADVVASLALLGQNFLLAILGLALALLSLVPLIALLRCMEDVSDLQSEVYSLRNRLHRLEGQLAAPEDRPVAGAFVSEAPQSKMTARERWTCSKCGSVNRAGINACESCGARYSFEQQKITDAPLTKWRLKENKKK